MLEKKDNIICVIHVATIGNYQQIVDEIFSYIKVNDFDKIIINIAGEGELLIPLDTNIHIIPTRSRLDEFEFSTLNFIKELSDENENLYICYLHTKGASTGQNICIDEWRRYMLHFNLKNVPNIIQLLQEFSAVGVDLVYEPVLHFSGNFWWTTSEHIKSLPYPKELPTIISDRHKCEFWIASNTTKLYKSLYNSNIDVYSRHLTRFPSQNYENYY